MSDYKWVTLDDYSNKYLDTIWVHSEYPIKTPFRYGFEWNSEGEMLSLGVFLKNTSGDIAEAVRSEITSENPTPIEETSIPKLLKIQSI